MSAHHLVTGAQLALLLTLVAIVVAAAAAALWALLRGRSVSRRRQGGS